MLNDLVGDVLPLSDSDSMIVYDYPMATTEQVQAVVLSTIRSMVADGLILIGDVPGDTEDSVDPWDLTLDQAMRRLHEIYVLQYEDEGKWIWKVWFGLTENGKREALEAGSHDRG